MRKVSPRWCMGVGTLTVLSIAAPVAAAPERRTATVTEVPSEQPPLWLDLFSGPPTFTEPAFRGSLLIDGLVTGALIVTGGTLWAVHSELASTTCPCDRASVPDWERGAVDFNWRGGDTTSNVILGAVLVAPMFLLSLDANRDAYLGDLVMVAEAASLAGVTTQITKTARSRPYPYMFRDPTPQQLVDGDNYAAMWSGHTAIAMATAVSFAAVWWRRFPDAWHRWLVATAGPVLALATGLLQMSAGNHFPSDVMVGAVAGAVSAGVVIAPRVLLEMFP